MAIGILLDGSNLLVGAQDLGGVPDYCKILEAATTGRPWTGVAVISAPPDGRPVTRLARMFEALGFGTRVWHPIFSAGGAKTNADTLVVAEGMRLLARDDVDEIVLGSGDSDFWVLAEEAERRGKGFSVACFRGSLSRVLCDLAERVVLLGPEHVLHRDRVARAA